MSAENELSLLGCMLGSFPKPFCTSPQLTAQFLHCRCLLRPLSELPTHLCKLCTAISQHQNLVVNSCRLAPRIHDESIIDCDAGDGVNSLGLELVCLLDETWQMLRAAGRCECSWNSEKHHLQISGTDW